jgi:ABC-type transporter Mla subunit MlaD
MLDRAQGLGDDPGALRGALTEAEGLLAGAVSSLRSAQPDAAELSAAVNGTHQVVTTLADLVNTVIDHVPTLAETHGPEVGREVAADLRALHGCLTSGALLLSPALDDLGEIPGS